jgi:outer membrane protein TolC
LSIYDGVLVTLISDVAQTYLNILTTEQRVTVAKKNVSYQEESVRIIVNFI